VWADVIRIFAIYSVLFIHSSGFLPQQSASTIREWILPLCGFIGVPLFVMLSGALLLGKKESYYVFFTKRCTRLLLPWVFWTMVYVLIDYYTNSKQLHSINDWIRYYHSQFLSRFWFLPMIFGLYLLVPVLNPLLRSVKQNETTYALLFWFFAFSFLPAIQELARMHIALDSSLLRQVLQHSGLFVLGYLLTRGERKVKTIRFWFIILFVGMTGTYFGVSVTSLLGNTDHSFFFTLFSPNMLLIIVAIFMLFYTFFQSRQKSMNQQMKIFLVEMSSATFGIYLSHELVTRVFVYYFPEADIYLQTISPLLAVSIRAMFIFLCSFIIIASLRRIPLLKYIL
jgi:surface polysaccharide O-acyltransferase-like enzyme